MAFIPVTAFVVVGDIRKIGVIDVRLFSSPVMIFNTMLPMLYSGEFVYHTLSVLKEYCWDS